MLVSLIVNTYNRMHTLPNALDAIQRLRYPHLEVIVVNGPSTDNTEEYLQKNWAGKLKILSCPEANLSLSRNIGIAAAAGDIVAFTDDDGIPEPNWLDELVQAYENPNIGAVGGFVRDNTGVAYQAKFIYSSRDGNSNTLMDSPLECETFTQKKEFQGMIGVNSSFRKSILIKAGGFDIEYAYFLDETDCCVRIINEGYKIKTVPMAEVHHKYAASHIRTEKGVPRTWLAITRSIAYFCIKNALPEQPLLETFMIVEDHRNKYRQHTNWARVNGNLTEHETNALLHSINEGISQGVKDAFSYPLRRLLFSDDIRPTDFLQFPRILENEKRKKIAFVTDLYPPIPCGGVAVFMHQLAEQLAKEGHEITVITFVEADNPHTVDLENGVWVHRLPKDHMVDVGVMVPHLPNGMRVVANTVLAEIDRVNHHRQIEWVVGAIWDLHVAAVLSSKRYKVGIYLVTSYGLMVESKKEWRDNQEFYNNHVVKMIEGEKWALDNADIILASTKAIAKDIENSYKIQLNKSKFTILPFGINPPSATSSIHKSEQIILLYVGRFETRKGIHILFDILPDLLNRNPNLVVRLIGNNEIVSPTGNTYLHDYSKNYSINSWFERIIVSGIVSDSELEQAYADCDIFVAPSLYESFGLIYVEAMKYGKSCVGTNVGGIPEVVVNNETGILVEVGNAKELNNAIQTLIDNVPLRETMGLRGYRRYLSNFTVEKFANGFIDALG